MSSVEIGILGVGAIGSWLEAYLPASFGCTFVDNQRVLPENVDVARFSAEDCFKPKASVAAARRRAAGGAGRALYGDVGYALGPGLVRELAGVVVALDNPSAIRDVTEILMGSDIRVPLLVLTCGNEGTGGGYQVRFFLSGRGSSCPCCFWGAGERDADRHGRGASCAATTAPRASAAAAEAAAQAGARLLLGWLSGDRSSVGARVQRDGEGGEYVIRMPRTPMPGCPVPHHPQPERLVDLGGDVGTVTLRIFAEHAVAEAGDDAEIVLGRRAVPTVGMQCPRCQLISPAPLRLLPAAASISSCACAAPLRPLAWRWQVSARELLAPGVGGLTLREFGAAAGDEFLVVGHKGAVRLAATFDWRELTDGGAPG
jgi:hypothetical protein